jgi:hypothetical protein
VMGYNRKEGFLDLMFPDFTYFGHEYSQIVGERTHPAAGTTPHRKPLWRLQAPAPSSAAAMPPPWLAVWSYIPH